MADEAFALSPIHARAAMPTDADYDAIHEAFMETARGRWFLTEYAKRNRNADTRMVLDAVERIEASLASQRQAQAEAETRAQAEALALAETHANARPEATVQPKPQIDLWPRLSEAFARARIEIAQRLIPESHEQEFEAIRASVETIRSVSWALRERGFEARICDFLDLQVNAITDGYTALLAGSSVAGDTEAEILAAFDALVQHVEALTNGSDAETEALDAIVDAVADAMGEDDSAPAIPADDDATALAPPAAEEPPAPIVEAAPAETAANHYAGFHEIYGDEGDIEIVEAAPLEEPAALVVPTEPEINRQRLYEAKLEPYRSAAAVRAAHAQEIAAAAAADIEIVDAASAATGAAPNPEPVQRPAPPVAEMTPAPDDQPSADRPGDRPASLGQALIASGVIQHPAGRRPDPLAPFRRMSQAEKVALFT